VQAEEILIGCFVECQSIKKWAVDVPWKNCSRLYFSFRLSRLNVSPSETKIEPDRRLMAMPKVPYSFDAKDSRA